MYARVSRAPIKPGNRPQIEAVCARLRKQTDQLGSGLTHWISLIGDDEVMIIAVYKDEAERDRTAAQNQQRWADAAHLLAAPPIITHCEMPHFHMA